MPLMKKVLVLALLLGFSSFKAYADDEWANTSAEELGISQEEYQRVKESGMSKSRFLKLLEFGISPNEYFSEPWKKLGVTEDHWINEKKAGMADDDIDRSYRKQDANNLAPFVSFLLPGYYEFKTGKKYTGLALSSLAVGGIAATILIRNEETNSINPIFPIITLGAMVWSAGNAYLGTRYVDNQEAGRFSMNLGLNENGGPTALFSLIF